MNAKPGCLLGALLAIGLFGAGSLVAADADSQAGSEKTAKPSVAKGMTAEEVRRSIGDPFKIKPIKNEDVKAESWIYRRTVRTDTTQEAVMTEQLPAFVGAATANPDGMGTVTVPVYRFKTTTITQVTALLMVDDKLEFAKQWLERDVRYDN